MIFDTTGISEGELHNNTFGASIRKHGWVLISRSGVVHGKYPTAIGYQIEGVDSTVYLERQDSSDSLVSRPSVDLVDSGRSVGRFSFNLSSWVEWLRWILIDGRHDPVVVAIGKGWQWDWMHPLLVAPMTVLSSVWIFQACNISIQDFAMGSAQAVWNITTSITT